VGLGFRHIGWHGEDKSQIGPDAATAEDEASSGADDRTDEIPAHLIGKSVHARTTGTEPSAQET
jgi:hypothetical protein